MLRVHQLPTISGTAAGRSSILLKGIPDRAPDGRGYNVVGFALQVRYDLSTAVSSALTMRQLLESLTVDVAHPRLTIHGTAHGLVMGELLASGGRGAMVPPSDMGASESNAVKIVTLPLLFAPPAADPSDFGVPAAALNDAEIAVTQAAPSGTGTVTMNSYTITAVALLAPENDVRVPAGINIEVLTKAMDDLLPAGVYTGLVILPNAAAFAASANISQVIVEAGSEPVLRSITPEGVLAAYAAGATPLPIGAASNPCGANDWTAGYASVLGLPLIYAPAPNASDRKLSGAVYAPQPVHVRVSGTATSLRYYCRYYRPISAADESQVLSALGVSAGDVVTAVKTLEGKSAPNAGIAAGTSGLVAIPRKVVAAQPRAAGVLGATRIKTVL